MTALAIRSRAGSSTCGSAATASETCSLIISQYCAGDRVTSSTSTFHSAASRSPAASYRALTYPGAAHRNIFGPFGSGGASTTSVAIACMTIDVHGFASGLTHTDEQTRPPGLSTRANSAVALATSGKNMYPKRTETLSKVASSKGQIVGAAHPRLDIGHPLLVSPSRCNLQHLRYEVGQNDTSFRREPGDTQARLTCAGCDIEMLVICSDAETFDNRGADRAQLIIDDGIPLVPANRQPRPGRSLRITDLIGTRHRPSSP